MSVYRFSSNALLRALSDGSGIVIYKRDSGDTLFLRSLSGNHAKLLELIEKSTINQYNISSLLGVDETEALHILKYLCNNELICSS
jgi:predicted transcriptional regulator